jgi:hypothetical protein
MVEMGFTVNRQIALFSLSSASYGPVFFVVIRQEWFFDLTLASN